MAEKSAVNPLKPQRKSIAGSTKRQFAYLLMVLPGVLFLLAFSYLPMPGATLAFKFYVSMNTGNVGSHLA